uniref:Titin n=1 Tax=Lates calcarifer TaxID=8187 RepID=A0A4W6BZU8_LATCA
MTDHFYEFRVAAENEAGIGDLSELSLFYRACDATTPPGPPHHPKVTDYTKSSVSLSWGKPDFDGGAYIKGYIVEMREYTPVPESTEAEVAPVVEKEWAMCTPPTGIQATKLTITDLKEGGEYQFRICAINSEGVGEAANVSGSVVTSDRSEAPEIELDADLRKVVSVRAGGTLRLFVTIRGRPEPAVKWERVEGMLTERAAIDTTSSYTMLVIDNVNRFDSGKYSLTLENSSGTKSAIVAVRILDTPSAPQNFAVKELKKDSVTLAWDTPLTDGGSKITNYIVEKRESVRKNAAGLFSEPSDNTGPITVKDDVDPPRIMMDVKFRETVFVKAGETLKINADLAGRPAPVVSWTKDGKEIELRARIQIVTTDTSTSVIVKDCIRRDSGQYALTLQNIAGAVTMPINCVIIDKPGPSAGPLQITGLTAEECTLSWGPPQEAGGADITHYVVEKRETSRLAWTLVKGDVTKTYFKVKGLQKGNEYIFRVLAVNKYGLGEALESDAVKVTDPYTIATAPAGVDVTAITGDSMTLTWCKPASDGGSPIIGYVIERREKTGMRWIRVNRDLVVECTTVATKLRKACEYDFRVYAENAAGLSPPSEPSATFRAMDPLVVPSRPTKPKIISSTKDSVSIVWKPPADDGGAPILGYSVIESPEELARWVEAIPLTKSLEFTITGLKTDAKYEFCVKAINKVGSSARSPYSDGAAAMDRTAEPSFDVDIEMRKVLIVKHGTAFTLNVPFKGKPVPSVEWAKEGVDLKVRGTIESTDSSTSLTIEKSNRNDSGEYSVTIESPLGKATLPMVVKVLDSPGPPVNVKVSAVTRDSATLTWEAPENDGGDAVKAYHVEKREASKKWVKCATVRTMTHTIKSLREGAEYFFRVRAENHAGLSTTSSFTTAFFDITYHSAVLFYFTEAPEFDLTNYPKNTVYVKAGSDLTFEIPLTGRPMPKVTMSKNNVVIKGSKRLLTEVTPDSLIITLNESISTRPLRRCSLSMPVVSVFNLDYYPWF